MKQEATETRTLVVRIGWQGSSQVVAIPDYRKSRGMSEVLEAVQGELKHRYGTRATGSLDHIEVLAIDVRPIEGTKL